MEGVGQTKVIELGTGTKPKVPNPDIGAGRIGGLRPSLSPGYVVPSE